MPIMNPQNNNIPYPYLPIHQVSSIEVLPNITKYSEYPPPRQGLSAVLYNQHQLILFGGYGGYKKRYSDINEIYVFDTRKKAFTQISTTGTRPTPRTGHSSVIKEHLLVVFGGYSGTNRCNDMYVCDLKRMHWDRITAKGTLPLARSHHSAVLRRESMFVFGGWIQQLQGPEPKVYVYNFETNTWSQVRDWGNKPSKRSHHSAVLKDDCMVVFGGFCHGKRYNDLWCLDLNNYMWKEIIVKGFKPICISEHTAVVKYNSMYIFGGYDGSIAYSHLYEFNFASNTWKLVQMTGKIPYKRYLHASVSVLDSIYIFSGYDGDHLSNDVFELNFGGVNRRIVNFAIALHSSWKYFVDSLFIFSE